MSADVPPDPFPRDLSPPAVTDSHILVVDDIEWNRALIGTLLEEAGYTRLTYAVDGEEALARIAEAQPDLVVLDIMMPGVDGFEVCRRLRANRAYADLPVLVQTALSGVEDRNRAFEAGTTDLVTKPLDRTELLARVRIHLENRVLIRSLQAYRDRLEGEMGAARSVFDHLLPGEAAIAAQGEATGLSIRSHIRRPPDLGGDIWGMLPLGRGRLGIYLLNMAGRDISAALNACRLHTLVHELVGLGNTPAGFLEELNRRAHDLLIGGEHAAMVYGVVAPSEDRFVYACADASAPLLLQADGAVLAGPGGGTALGATADARFDQHELRFPAGAALVLHSNSLAGLEEVLANPGSRDDLAVVFRRVAETLEQGAAAAPADDNHALVWLGREGAMLGVRDGQQAD